jgi:esterase/lipase superfamily enzyme
LDLTAIVLSILAATITAVLSVWSHLSHKKKKKKKRKKKLGGKSGPHIKPEPNARSGAEYYGGVRSESPTQPTLAHPREYRVWFGTDRRPSVAGDYALGFSDEFDAQLHFGSCSVFIPKSHNLGSLGSPFFIRLARIALGKEADEPLKLLAIDAGCAASIQDELAARLAPLLADSREILLYIHGYNVSFKEAAIRAAQIGADLGLTGPMVFFSWPSSGKMYGYPADEATVERSKKLFLDFIEILSAVPGLRALNVIAHSMGNRLMQHAADLIDARGQHAESQRLGHIIVAAPDMDREVFRQTATVYARLKATQRRTTLYWNRSDHAVGLSRLLHRYQRAGTYGAGIDHIDSILWFHPRFRLDMLGHGYFAEAEPVLRDIQQLLREHAPPSRRHNLIPVPRDRPQYWELRA